MFLSIDELETSIQKILAPLILYKNTLEKSLPTLEKKLVDYFYQEQFHGILEKFLPSNDGVLVRPSDYSTVDDFLNGIGFKCDQNFWRLPQGTSFTQDEQDFLNQFALSFSLLRNAHIILMGINEILNAQQESLKDAITYRSKLAEGLSVSFADWDEEILQAHFNSCQDWREQLREKNQMRFDAALLDFTKDNKFSTLMLSLTSAMAAKLEDGYNNFPDPNWIYTSDWKNLVVEMISAIFSDKYHYEGWVTKTMAIISNTGLKGFFNACTQVCEQLPKLNHQLYIAYITDARDLMDERLSNIERFAAESEILLELHKPNHPPVSRAGYFGGAYAGYLSQQPPVKQNGFNYQ